CLYGSAGRAARSRRARGGHIRNDGERRRLLRDRGGRPPRRNSRTRAAAASSRHRLFRESRCGERRGAAAIRSVAHETTAALEQDAALAACVRARCSRGARGARMTGFLVFVALALVTAARWSLPFLPAF